MRAGGASVERETKKTEIIGKLNWRMGAKPIELWMQPARLDSISLETIRDVFDCWPQTTGQRTSSIGARSEIGAPLNRIHCSECPAPLVRLTASLMTRQN